MMRMYCSSLSSCEVRYAVERRKCLMHTMIAQRQEQVEQDRVERLEQDEKETMELANEYHV